MEIEEFDLPKPDVYEFEIILEEDKDNSSEERLLQVFEFLLKEEPLDT